MELCEIIGTAEVERKRNVVLKKKKGHAGRWKAG
jgi:hypothetical protein